jgi:hypothetical protein
MARIVLSAPLFLLIACGGGGGSSTSPVGAPTRLAASAVELAPGATAAELTVTLAEVTDAPTLLTVAFELPPALTIAASPLTAAQPVPTLDGNLHDGRFVVVCGDARNKVAQPLQPGPLFRLRLATTSPRLLGTHTITLRNLTAARSDGSAANVEPNPTTVTVTVR